MKRLTSYFAAVTSPPKYLGSVSLRLLWFYAILARIKRILASDFKMRFCDLYNALVMLTFKARNSYEMFRVLLMVAYSSAFKTSSISVLRTFQPIWKIRYYFVSFHFPNSASSFSATESPFETMCFKIATISELYQLSSERKSRDGLCVDNDLWFDTRNNHCNVCLHTTIPSWVWR